MSFYLNLLYNNLGINIYLTIILFLMTCIVTLFLIFMLIILFLDSLYRPNIPQYPFNIILDRIIPLITLFFPSIIIYFSQPFETWFSRLALLIMIHSLILAPIFYYWSQLRRWHNNENDVYYQSWKHPRLYYHISIALIYPLLWGIFFSLSRFLRLGAIYNIWDYIKISLNDIIVILFLMPYLMVWIAIIFLLILQKKNHLWNIFSSLLYSIHIYLLQYYIYFKFMELLHKSGFFITCLLTLNVAYDNKGAWYQRFTNYFYYNTKWITFIMFCLVIFEIFLTNKIYYGLYILFVYTCISRTLSCYFAYAQTDFVYDCCYSDYCFLNIENIKLRYPHRFWTYFNDAEHYFGFEYSYTRKQAEMLSNEMKKPKAKWILCKKIPQDVHQDRVNLRVQRKPYAPFYLRVAASYLHVNRVRWMHTERIINKAVNYHSCTALFTKTFFDKVVLINSNWKHLNHIQAAKIVTPHPSFPIYRPFNQTFTPKRQDFIGMQEENIPSNFKPLIEKGVKVEPYDTAIKEHQPVYLLQASPDTVFIFKNGKFIDQRTHALDQKTNNPGLGNNKILSEITTERYRSTIDRFEKQLKCSKGLLNNDILTALLQLKETCHDFEKHQLSWAKNLHLFPDNFIPPSKLPQNFSYTQFHSEALHQIKLSEIRMQKISDYLYAKKVPQINHGVFPQQALDLFEDSQLQQILGDVLSEFKTVN